MPCATFCFCSRSCRGEPCAARACYACPGEAACRGVSRTVRKNRAPTTGISNRPAFTRCFYSTETAIVWRQSCVPATCTAPRAGEELLLPEIERQQKLSKEVAFRADAAFAKPEIYEALESRREVRHPYSGQRSDRNPENRTSLDARGCSLMGVRGCRGSQSLARGAGGTATLQQLRPAALDA